MANPGGLFYIQVLILPWVLHDGCKSDGSGWIEDFGFVFGFERFDFGFMEIQEVRGLLRMFLQVEMMGMNET